MAGRAGRKPKPTRLHLLHGNPGHRKRNRSEPQPNICVPTPPTHVRGEALKEWKRIAPELEKLGLISKIDRAALAAYCVAYARWCEAEKELKKGLIVVSPNGYPIPSPYVSIANRALKQIREFATEFGMTPSSRSRVQASPDRGKTPLGEYLGRGRSA